MVKIKHGTTIKEYILKDFVYNFDKLINDNMLQPGWNTQVNLHANYVSAKALTDQTPLSLKQALSTSNKDSNTCLKSYNEEYEAIRSLNVYEEITWDD